MKIKMTEARKDALEEIRRLHSLPEATKGDVMHAFSRAKRVFGKVQTFSAVEAAAWDMVLAGGCWGKVWKKLEEFAKTVEEQA